MSEETARMETGDSVNDCQTAFVGVGERSIVKEVISTDMGDKRMNVDL